MRLPNISSTGAIQLFDALKQSNSKIVELYLRDHRTFEDDCMKSIGEYIQSNKYIQGITLNNTSISDTSIELLAPYLDGNTTFKSIHFSGCEKLTNKSLPFLTKMIESSAITYIDISLTSITEQSALTVLTTRNIIRYGSHQLHIIGK